MNAAREALTRAVNRAIAEGAPIYTEQNVHFPAYRLGTSDPLGNARMIASGMRFIHGIYRMPSRDEFEAQTIESYESAMRRAGYDRETIEQFRPEE